MTGQVASGSGDRQSPSTWSYSECAVPPQLDGLLSLLSDDERPTFILNTSDAPHASIAYRNPSLLALIADDAAFQTWATALPVEAVRSSKEDAVVTVGTFAGKIWLSKRIGHGSWTVVYCSVQQHNHVRKGADGARSPRGLEDAFTGASPTTSLSVEVRWNGSSTDQKAACSPCPELDYSSDKISNWFFDWTKCPFRLDDPWINFLKDYDWSATALGPMDQWPRDLSRLAIYVLSAPDPRLIIWGDDWLCLFNAAARPILGDRYLACLGNPLGDGLGHAVVEQDLDCLRTSLKSGTSIKESRLEYTLTRYGFPEEANFDFHIAPVPGIDGFLIGAVIEFSETTSAMLIERKQHTSSAVFESIKQSKELADLWPNLAQSFVTSPKFISCAAIYTSTYDAQGTEPGAQYHLRSCAGVDADMFPSVVDVEANIDRKGLGVAFHDARESQAARFLRHEDGTLPKVLAIDIPDRGPVHTACVFSIETGVASKGPLAFFVLYFSPKFHVRSNEAIFVRNLRELVTKTCALITLPEEQRRDRDLEILNNDLASRLRITTSQAQKSEENFSRMARNAPFGMYMFSPDGSPIFLNEAWLRLSGFANKEEFERVSQGGPFWRDRVPPEDMEEMATIWSGALKSKIPTKHEHRVKFASDSIGSKTDTEYHWLEAVSFPELDENDDILSIQGWLIDITDRKLAQNFVEQRLADALETKRASERFIDMVSHEIRNPLSAILQLADGMLGSTIGSAESTADTARTIMLCAQHQKKIVDDVLTISKLDSNLLVLSPDTCDPPALVQKALKMHESELDRTKIQASLQVEQSYKDLAITSVMLDESRFLQVVINLVGNAIKFTQEGGTRQITISLSALREVPTGSDHNITFAAPRVAKRPALQRSSSAGRGADTPGQDIYLQLAIKDTGRGLNSEDVARLFRRFSQASPKTYKKYGGSGLGLYISKELTELQGGQIGVKSDGLGKGSTFAFYVRTMRAEGPLMSPSLETSVSLKEFPGFGNTDKVGVITKSSHTKVSKKGVTGKLDSCSSDLHVLGVVEDNAINQKVMAQQLRRVGCTVHVANHGMEALAFLETTSFQQGHTPLSIILLDVEMPVMDGLTCARRIRQLENTGEIARPIPIIAVTANARNQQIADALKAGVDEVATKPFRIPDLLPRMEALVTKMSDGQ